MNAIADFVAASFDTLRLAIKREDPADRLFVPRSFLANKVPAILEMLSTINFVPINYEVALSQALGHINEAMMPNLLQDFGHDEKNAELSQARTDFLCSCMAHGLVSKESTERFLGGTLTRSVTSARVHRPHLVAEYDNNSSKLESYVDKLETMDGNAIAYVGAVSEVSPRSL